MIKLKRRIGSAFFGLHDVAVTFAGDGAGY